jgi:tetratricopeptide (TPR) repeat protein
VRDVAAIEEDIEFYDAPEWRDRQQELWRFAGDLDRAAAAAQAWREEAPDVRLAHDRLGEIRFLQARYADAADLFAQAAEVAGGRHKPVQQAEALVKQGTALVQNNTPAEAEELFTVAADRAEPWLRDERVQEAAGVTLYHALAQRGDLLLREGRYSDATTLYKRAKDIAERFNLESGGFGRPPALPQVLDNNLAIALAQTGDGDASVHSARAAVAADPESPVFLQTLAFAEQTRGNRSRAIEHYRASLRRDPTLFTAANDLGVLLMQAKDLRGAEDALRQAVAAKADYAFGWFNLGVVLSRRSEWNITAAQGAFARAIRLDRSLLDREREPILDSEPYFTTLDLSRPLPPDWNFATIEERGTIVISGAALLLLLLHLGRVVGAETGGGWLSRQAIRLSGGRLTSRLTPFARFWPPVIAVVATVALSAWPLLRDRAPVGELVLIAAGTLVLVALYLRSRTHAALRSGLLLRHQTWVPSVAVGATMTLVGLAWSPVPVAHPKRAAFRLWWVAPLALAIATAALVGLSRLTGVPATRGLALAGLVLTASVLTPIAPFDGAFIRGRWWGIAASSSLLVAAVLMAMGVL